MPVACSFPSCTASSGRWPDTGCWTDPKLSVRVSLPSSPGLQRCGGGPPWLVPSFLAAQSSELMQGPGRPQTQVSAVGNLVWVVACGSFLFCPALTCWAPWWRSAAQRRAWLTCRGGCADLRAGRSLSEVGPARVLPSPRGQRGQRHSGGSAHVAPGACSDRARLPAGRASQCRPRRTPLNCVPKGVLAAVVGRWHLGRSCAHGGFRGLGSPRSVS